MGLLFKAPGIVVDPNRKNEIPADFYLRTARNRWIFVQAPDELPNHDGSSGPLLLICLNELQEGVIDSTPAVLVELLNRGIVGNHIVRLIMPVMTRIMWVEHVDVFVNGATDISVVSDEAEELGWTWWCLQ